MDFPLFAAVPSEKLAGNCSASHQRGSDSVNNRSGHRSYGIILKIGSGRLVSQIVRGQCPDVHLSKNGCR